MKGGEKLKGTIIQFEKHTQPKGETTMKNKMLKVLKNEKGLTLIELLAVIVILAIVAAIAVPAIGNIIDNSRYNAVKADATNIINAANLYYTDNPGGDATGAGGVAGSTVNIISVEQLIATKYLDSAGTFPKTTTLVSSTSPRGIWGTSEQKVNGKSIIFAGATLDLINAAKEKGSDLPAGNKTIGTVTTAPAR